MKELICIHCGHRWMPRTNKKPFKCPNPKCQRIDWEVSEYIEPPNEKDSPIIIEQPKESTENKSQINISAPEDL